MTADTVVTILYALVLAIGVAMTVRPSAFLSSGLSDEKGVRVIGILFALVGGANLIERISVSNGAQ